MGRIPGRHKHNNIGRPPVVGLNCDLNLSVSFPLGRGYL
jgi:hypothetical protein